VARQYCGRLGKKANCQVLVSLTLARGEVPVPLGPRLFLPDEWVADPDRCARAGVPDEHRRAEAKTDIALAEVDRVLAAGARFRAVLADAGYGTGAAFRRGLSARSLVWAVGVLKTQNVYPPTIELRWPAARPGRPRKHPVPSEAPVAAEAMLAGGAWRRVSWRRGTMIGDADHPVRRTRAHGPRGGRWRPRSLPCGCARPRARGSATAGTCPGTRSGWWASAAPPASAGTTSPTSRPRRRSGSWRR
jgi:SRSO17 transposase